MTKRVITSVDVARHAGVSQSAVSRAFSATASISDVMRERVLQAARELHYRPNRIPGIMLSGRSGMVGVIIGGLQNPLYGSALERLSAALRAAGYQMLLVQVMDSVTLDAALGQLAGYRVDALIAALAIGSTETASALSALGIPVICFNSSLTGPGLSSVQSNNRDSGQRAAKIMAERDVRHAIWLSGPLENAASQARRTGFLSGCATHGVRVTECDGEDLYQGGFDAITGLLEQHLTFDGLFASNDLMACGALDALHSNGRLTCPHDVIVIGYDNIQQAAWHSYDLTSFDQRHDRLVAAALDILGRALLAPETRLSETVVIEAKLVERGSTAR